MSEMSDEKKPITVPEELATLVGSLNIENFYLKQRIAATEKKLKEIEEKLLSLEHNKS